MERRFLIFPRAFFFIFSTIANHLCGIVNWIERHSIKEGTMPTLRGVVVVEITFFNAIYGRPGCRLLPIH